MERARRENAEPVPVEDVRAAAVEFVSGLAGAFGLEATTSSEVDGNEIEVRIDADGRLGLLIGPGGRTLLAIQDLARVAAQRRLGDHDTRLRVDVAGYREKRRAALERFAARSPSRSRSRASPARSTRCRRPTARSSTTRWPTIDGVASRSEGEDPNRRVIVSPAEPRRPARRPFLTQRSSTPSTASQRLGMLGDAPDRRRRSSTARRSSTRSAASPARWSISAAAAGSLVW